MTPQERESASNVITEAIADAAAKRIVDASDRFLIGEISHVELLSFAAARLLDCGITDLTVFETSSDEDDEL